MIKAAKAYKSPEKILTFSKLRLHPSPVTSLDNLSENSIKNHTYSMYDNKDVISNNMLLERQWETNIFAGSEYSLIRILHNIGFEYFV